jgi:16S rRNA (cytosine967-C5)-methyltransferase
MKNQKNKTVRTLAAQISYDVIYKKNNLSDVFRQRLTSVDESKAAIKALCFATIRHFLYLEDIWCSCLTKKPKDKMVRILLSQALAELKFLQKPQHAIVNETINAAKKLNKKWAVGLINSCLRKAAELENFQPSCEPAKFEHPQWWIDKLKHDWPDYWQKILQANNQKPPLWIRTNLLTANDITAQPHENIMGAFQIKAQDITQLPAFIEGKLSVQDASAQLAAQIINPKDGERILDACAAPGGKTGHLLEINNQIKLDALELYPNRAKKIQENLDRLHLEANIIVADTCQFQQQFKGEKYQKILLDAPCSASGILRRHPDIKFIRQKEDLKNICKDQQKLLFACADLLADNGCLLYATCSVFKQENSDQIKLFLQTHPHFSEIKLEYPFSIACEYGIQIISGKKNMDGFYYCYLRKHES